MDSLKLILVVSSEINDKILVFRSVIMSITLLDLLTARLKNNFH